MKVEKRFDDFGYVVVAKLNSKVPNVEFSVHRDNVHQKPIFLGYIGWEGCSNWQIKGQDENLHFCNPKEAIDFGVLLSRLYDWAAELMPEHKNNLGDKNDPERRLRS